MVITLENEKGKENQQSAKKLRPLERAQRDKESKTVSCVSKNSNRNIRSDIHSRGYKTKSSNAIPRSVPTEGRIYARTDFLTDKQVEKIEYVSLPKTMAKCGYNRYTALPIRGGSKELGGAGLY